LRISVCKTRELLEWKIKRTGVGDTYFFDRATVLVDATLEVRKTLACEWDSNL
jgi:hypothetical protein